MSSAVTVQPTEFKSVRTGEITYGVRVYDDQACTYQNTWDFVPDDDLEVLRLALDNADDVAQGIFDFVEENKYGIYIGSEWYEWDEIMGIFE
jgi:hypothetical protein